jgi:LysR family transcriptional regulator, hydrogen peroxide-inducible genes activator
MTLLQLSYVIELAKQQSFSKSASALGISQPALSLQISKLEEELGIKLFRRSQTSIDLTTEGEAFVEKARDVLQMVDQLMQLPVELENRPEGELRIGIIPTLAPYWVPLFMNEFHSTYPDIKLTVNEMKTSEIIAELKNGRIDAGLLSTPIDTNGIVFTPLFYEEFFLYVSDKHPLFEQDEINLSQVELEDAWYLEEGNCFQNQVNAVCTLASAPGEKQSMVYLSNSIESLCKIIERGGGITFIPELATLSVSADQEEMIKSIAGAKPIREISLATTRFSKSDRLLGLFVEEAMKPIPQRMKNKPVQTVLSTGLRL